MGMERTASKVKEAFSGANNGRDMSVGAFSVNIKEHLRTSGHSQKELADVLGLHPKVLNRKLNGSGHAHLTHLEVQRIIMTLADWHVITSQEEVIDLLRLAQVRTNIFSAEEWQAQPLSMLTMKDSQSVPLSEESQSLSFHQYNLPPPATRLIGREWAVARLRELLGRDEVRLVTLMGSGGSGKTRLALHVANQLAGSFEHGVCFVSLAGISDPALTPMSIIQALNMQSAPNVSPLEGLITYLKQRQLLLVLDNFEQVGEATKAVDELLAGVPGLKVLVTSRAVLHLYGEYQFGVPPLDIPDPCDRLEASELLQFEAIQLFVERAQAALPDFALSGENAAVIAQICARVDGLPLAIELAAARIKVLPPTLLLERLLQARLPVLIGGAKNLPRRQQTLYNTIAWSYNLLTREEQTWFRSLGVFADGLPLEAAEAMANSGVLDSEGKSASVSPMDMLQQLVDNSLLIRLPTTDGQARFRMLETLREYALNSLSSEGERERLQDWHACFYLREAESAERGLRGPKQLIWLARVEAERNNFSAALEWSLQKAKRGWSIVTSAFFTHIYEALGENRAIAGSRTFSAGGVAPSHILARELYWRLSAALRHYWEWKGFLPEGQHWLEAALELPIEDGAKESTIAARAKAWSEASRLACLQMDREKAVKLADESLLLWRQLDDPEGLATALVHRGWAAHTLEEHELAKQLYREGLQHISATGNTWLRAQLLFYMGAAAGFTDDSRQMQIYYTQSRKLFEQLGDKSAVADVLKDQGGMTLLHGKYAEAIQYLLKSLSLCYELGHKQYMTTGMCLLSIAFGMTEKPSQAAASVHAAKLQGVADCLMDEIGLHPWTCVNAYAQMMRQHIRSRIDEKDWREAWFEGRALTLEEALHMARQFEEDLHA